MGVTGYRVERCQGAGCATFTQVATPSGTTYNDPGRAAATSYSYRVRATDAAANLGPYSNTASATTAGASDTAPPAVSITAPVANALVSGIVTVAASATDNIAVVGVQFKLNGVNLGAEVTTAPYYVSWNTTTVSDGPKTITAVARDAANNTTTSSPITATVANATATDPSRIGQWSARPNWPLVAIHMTLLPNGQILAWDGAAELGAAYQWNPSTNAFTAVLPPDNIFCAGHAPLADGRLFVVGGRIANYVGIADANFFDPVTRVWSAAPSMTVEQVVSDGNSLA